MRFLRRIEGVTLFSKVRSSEIWKSVNIEPLLLRIERSQLRWFSHVRRMPQKRLSKQAILAKANGRRPVGWPKTRRTNYIENLGWNRLGLHSSEMMDVMEKCGGLISSNCYRDPHGKAGNEKRSMLRLLVCTEVKHKLTWFGRNLYSSMAKQATIRLVDFFC